MAGARNVAAGLSGELERAKSAIATTNNEVKGLSAGLSRNLSRAFESVVFDGQKLSDALARVGRSMVNSAFSAAMRPISNQFSGLVSTGVQNLVAGALPFAKGGAPMGGRLSAFAAGGDCQDNRRCSPCAAAQD